MAAREERGCEREPDAMWLPEKREGYDGERREDAGASRVWRREKREVARESWMRCGCQRREKGMAVRRERMRGRAGFGGDRREVARANR